MPSSGNDNAVAGPPADLLTGLLGNDALVDACRAAIEAANGGEHVAVAYFSFDGLRELNLRSGHLVTDHIVRELSRRLRATLRECDQAGRVANDEFVVILRQLGSRLETMALFARLRVALAEPIKSGKSAFIPIVNFGMAVPPTDGSTLEALSAAAEKQMLAMRDQMQAQMREDALKRIVAAREAVKAAGAGVTDAELAVRNADAHLVDAKKRLADARVAVVVAVQHAKELGIADAS
jgi:diguanylate cyclase (GGDEF)-like protein